MAKEFRCMCGEELSSISAMVNHYRKNHADGAQQLYSQVGTVGDPFVDRFVRAIWDKNRELTATIELERKQADALAKKYDYLIEHHNKLRSAVSAVNSITSLVADEVNGVFSVKLKEA